MVKKTAMHSTCKVLCVTLLFVFGTTAVDARNYQIARHTAQLAHQSSPLEPQMFNNRTLEGVLEALIRQFHGTDTFLMLEQNLNNLMSSNSTTNQTITEGCRKAAGVLVKEVFIICTDKFQCFVVGARKFFRANIFKLDILKKVVVANDFESFQNGFVLEI